MDGIRRQAAGFIEQKLSGSSRVLVTIDGPCASGKTTLAAALAEALHADVLHTDDFVIPHSRKTAEHLAVPGGNCDADRLVSEAIRPWKEHQPVRFRRYDCIHDCLLPEETLPETGLLILEGAYCNLPQIRRYADLCFFVNTSLKIREERLQKRESPRSLERYYSLWIPLENAYFRAYNLPDPGCIILDGNNEKRMEQQECR